MLSIDTEAFDEYLKDNAKRNRQNDITNLSKAATYFDPLLDQDKELFNEADTILSLNDNGRLAEKNNALAIHDSIVQRTHARKPSLQQSISHKTKTTASISETSATSTKKKRGRAAKQQ